MTVRPLDALIRERDRRPTGEWLSILDDLADAATGIPITSDELDEIEKMAALECSLSDAPGSRAPMVAASLEMLGIVTRYRAGTLTEGDLAACAVLVALCAEYREANPDEDPALDDDRAAVRERVLDLLGRMAREIAAAANGKAKVHRRQAHPEKILSVREAARELGMGSATAYDAIRTGTFPVPVTMIGNRQRILRADLERFLNGKSRPRRGGGQAAAS